MPIPRFVVIGALGLVAGLVPAGAQSASGSIRGQVTDPAGANIPGAAVSANNVHGVSRSATADLRGQYLLSNLPAGPYTVRVSSRGFAPAVRTDIMVGSGAS